MPKSYDDMKLVGVPDVPADEFLDLRQSTEKNNVLRKKLGTATPVTPSLVAAIPGPLAPGPVNQLVGRKVETRELPLPPVYHTLENPECKPGRAYNDGPSVPEQCQPEYDSCRKPKAHRLLTEQNYVEGFTILANGRSLEELVENRVKLRKATGVLTDQGLKAGGGQYEENKNYSLLKMLGKGSFGEVAHCQDNSSHKEFVRKTVSFRDFLRNEAVIPYKLPHPNLTNVYGLLMEPKLEKVHILLEYAGVGLNSYSKLNQLNEVDSLMLIRDGCIGLAYLHRYGVTHYDIKPENVCVFTNKDGSLSFKITDFGSCKSRQDPFTGDGMTVEYLAPEIAQMVIMKRFGVAIPVQNTNLTGTADVFAMGLVLLYLYLGGHVLINWVTGGKNHYDSCTDKKIDEYRSCILIQLGTKAFVHELIPKICSNPDVCDVIVKMVEFDPEKRILAANVVTELNGILDKQKEATRCFPQISSIDINSLNINSAFLNMMNDQQVVVQETGIPDIAQATMDMETGAMKHGTREKLRQKLHQPYDKGFKGQRRGSVSGHGHHRKIMVDESEIMEVEAYGESPGTTQVTQESTGTQQGLSHGQSSLNVPLPVVQQHYVVPVKNRNKTKRTVRPLKNKEVEETETVAMESDHHGNAGVNLPNFDSLF